MKETQRIEDDVVVLTTLSATDKTSLSTSCRRRSKQQTISDYKDSFIPPQIQTDKQEIEYNGYIQHIYNQIMYLTSDKLNIEGFTSKSFLQFVT